MKNAPNKQADEEFDDAREQFLTAAAAGKKLCIAGAATKSFLAPPSAFGNPEDANVEVFSLPGNVGIVSYQPSELVITVRAATKLNDVVAALAEKNQMLGFEPPSFGDEATIGGTVASALSGPARPYFGSIRDAVLGIKIMTGKGDVARFGGEVMKNVAGYDISRLFVGSMGSLGMLLEVSLRVQPIAKSQTFVCLPCSEREALIEMARLKKMSLPLSGVAYAEDNLHVRLAGSEIGVERALQDLKQFSPDEAAFWHRLNEQQLDFFNSTLPLWRLSLPFNAELASTERISGDRLWDWGGGLCWIKTDESALNVCSAAESLSGAASIFRNGENESAPRNEKITRLRNNLKAAFDPNNVLLARGYWRDLAS